MLLDLGSCELFRDSFLCEDVLKKELGKMWKTVSKDLFLLRWEKVMLYSDTRPVSR